jgi:hypothetical protein
MVIAISDGLQTDGGYQWVAENCADEPSAPLLLLLSTRRMESIHRRECMTARACAVGIVVRRTYVLQDVVVMGDEHSH